MIAVISRVASPRDLARYLHGPGPNAEHRIDGRPGGFHIGGNTVAGRPYEGGWAEEFDRIIKWHPKVVRPVWHMTLRAHPDDPILDDWQWGDIAVAMGESMGWERWPWVLVRNGDRHVHVVVCRVGWDGSQRVWTGSRDYYSAQRACREVESRFGLRGTVVGAGTAVALSANERAAARRTGQAPARRELAARVLAVAQLCAGAGRERFEMALYQQGVSGQVRVTKSGRILGYSFALRTRADAAGELVWFKASQLDRELVWSRLGAVLEGREDPV